MGYYSNAFLRTADSRLKNSKQAYVNDLQNVSFHSSRFPSICIKPHRETYSLLSLFTKTPSIIFFHSDADISQVYFGVVLLSYSEVHCLFVNQDAF